MRHRTLVAVLGAATSAALVLAASAPPAVPDRAAPAPVWTGTGAPPVQDVDQPADLSSVEVPGPDGSPTAIPKDPDGLADPALQAVVDDVLAGRVVDPEVAIVDDGRIRVEVVGEDPQRLVRALGGTVVGSIEGLVLADVAAGRIEELEARGGVDYVRFPQSAGAPVDDGAAPAPGTERPRARGSRGREAVTKTGIDLWHRVGRTGQGIKVGIIDTFSGATWNAAVAAGELAGNPAGAFCRWHGTGCGSTFWSGGNHGVSVAEVISDMAPGATLYVATAGDASDVRAAVDYFAAQGVRIISRSLTGVYDGPGNGAGPMADVVAYAQSRGIAWFNSAGNSAGGPGYQGSYFRSSWSDTDGDGWMNFPSGSEYLAFNCHFVNGLRWSDWGGNRTDYDLYVYDDPGQAPIASSRLDQQAGAWPLETFVDGAGCNGRDVDYIAIQAYAPGGGTSGDVLEFMVNGSGVQSWSNPHSVTQPAGDLATSGAAVIGAVDPVNGTTIAPYSSQGPTNDGRIKPDLSAASNMTSFSGGGRFNGTSAATPVAAGAAAVLLRVNPGWTPAQLVAAVRGHVVARGAPGPDPVYGTGELRLRPPGGPPGRVRGLRVAGARSAPVRRVTWLPPSSTGGLTLRQYVVEVRVGRTRLLRRVLPAGQRSLNVSRGALRSGRNTAYVTVSNGLAWAPWVASSFQVVKRRR